MADPITNGKSPARGDLAAVAPTGVAEGALGGPAMLLLMVAAHLIVATGSTAFEFVAHGVLFTLLWALPVRRWAWPIAGSIVGLAVASGFGGSPGTWQAAHVIAQLPQHALDPLAIAVGPALLHARRVPFRGNLTLERQAQLFGAVLSSALAGAVASLATGIVLSRIGELHFSVAPTLALLREPTVWPLVAGFTIQQFLGVWIAGLMIAPAAVWWMTPQCQPGSRDILASGMRYLVPTMAVYALTRAWTGLEMLDGLPHLMLLVAIVAMALRHGWRGAAAATLVSGSTVLALHFGTENPIDPLWVWALLAVSSLLALLLGASMDATRRHVALLEESNARARALADDLHAAAVRNLKAEERERRRLAADLHDEFGQGLAAMQTHLALARRAMEPGGVDRDPDPAVVRELLQTFHELTRSMRRNIVEVLDTLKPGALDELGLYGAIERGAIRRLAQDAGLQFETSLDGDARLLQHLTPMHTVAAYRLVQESVTNVVRHAQASHCRVRMRINYRNDAIWLFIRIDDDGLGRAGSLSAGNGLKGMRDRVLALGGMIEISDRDPGLKVHAMIRQTFAEFD